MKNIFWIVIAVFIVANLVIFLQGLTLGDQIARYESQIIKLKDENTDLEKKVYELQSFSRASSVAAQLSYTKKANPLYIDNLLYAKN